jgi:Tol biopolymer transport system component
VFDSPSGNLVAGDTNGRGDIFVRDRATGVTSRITDVPPIQYRDALLPRISADGRIVAYMIYDGSTGTSEVYAYDLTTGHTVLVSATPTGTPAGAFSQEPEISGDGRFVAFSSDAANLVADDHNGYTDIFVRDLLTNTTRLVSLDTLDRQFDSDALYPSISADGKVVAFIGGTNTFVRLLAEGRTELVSVNLLGLPAGPSREPTGLSADGRYVLFGSTAGYLVKGDPLLSFFTGEKYLHVYLRDRVARKTVRVSVNNKGVRANQSSFVGAISATGKVVAFSTAATNLDPTDTNGDLDVYLRLLRGEK